MSDRAPLARAARRLRGLLRNQRAATAVEYGLICALIVLAMIVSLKEVANTTVGIWTNVSNQVVSH